MPYEAHIDFKYERTTTMNGVFDNAFTITSLEDNNTIAFNQDLSNAGFIYSLDGGMSWQSVTSATICILDAGESVMIRNTSPIMESFNCPWPRLFSTEMKDFNVSGNIMSLLTKDYKNFKSLHYVDEDEGIDFYFDNILQFVFSGTNVVDASGLILPATELSDHCYYRMFNGCTKLQTAPKLPATTLADWCYANMFQGCTSLKECPELPATLLPSYCYACMFGGCTSLVATPEFPDFELREGDTNQFDSMFENCTGIVSGPVLSCDTLTENCYIYMFSGCTNMVNPPVLKATNLAYGCYESMFEYCSSLVNAPELPAIQLPERCYAFMFRHCTNLSYIKIYAITREDNSLYDNSLYNWVDDVAPTGVFIKQQGVTYPINSIDGVPIGWTIYELGDQLFDMYAVSLSVDPEGAGTVEGAGRYMRTTYVTVSAFPANNYMFDHWEANGINVSNDALYTFRMNYDIHLTAKFVVDTNDYEHMYFTIESLENNNKIYIRTYASDGPFMIYYKVNNVWESFSIATPKNEDVLITTLNKHDTVCLASNKSTWEVPYNENIGGIPGHRITTTKKYKAYGNLLSMVLYDEELNIDDSIFYYDGFYQVPSGCFRYFFKGSPRKDASQFEASYIVDASNLVLPSSTIGNWAYADMFSECYELLYAPKRLYATSVSFGCYFGMFNDCYSLLTIPILPPVTTLAEYCYCAMFSNCRSLTSIPYSYLPATTLADSCYEDMFLGCSSLVDAPALPATSLAYLCYANMFNGCTSLSTAPELNATSLADDCYRGMFRGCTSLVTAPLLPATSLYIYCYYRMFRGCTSLTNAPELLATELKQSCYEEMFYDCEKINYIKILANTRATDDTKNWVHNVATTGIFVKDENTEYLIDNDSGIPLGWTVYDYVPATVFYNIYIINNNPDHGTVIGEGRYAEGSTITLRAIPNEGYSFRCWMYNGIQISTNAEFSFTATQDATITVIWDRYHDYEHEYLTLESLSDNNKVWLTAGMPVRNSDYSKDNRIYGTIQYCINDDRYWTTYDVKASEDYCCILNEGDYIKIKNLQYDETINNPRRLRIYCNNSCTVYGNIMSLYEAHLDTTQSTIDRYVGQNLSVLSSDEIFSYLFAKSRSSTIQLDNYKLVSAKNLILPATTLSENCYEGMFADYNSNVAAYNMSLVEAPELPATTLASCCYSEMFYNGISLTAAPTLPATTLGSSCYEEMFYNCISLTTVPALPATTLADYCYKYMFAGCTSLTTIPSNYLPATAATDSCYKHMFAGCTLLTTTPTLPATTEYECYSGMFAYCTSLTTAPVLPATTLHSKCYESMFEGCTSLTTIPNNMLPATSMIPESTSSVLPSFYAELCYGSMFKDCTSLVTVPNNMLPATALDVYCYEEMFSGCTSLTNVPELPATTMRICCYHRMFEGCTSLTTVSNNLLPAITLNESCYGEMFKGCTSLTNAPELPASLSIRTDAYCYKGMFEGCVSLTDAPTVLPSLIIPSNCYEYMFKGCTSLTYAPILPATTLQRYQCYKGMFDGCTSLNHIEAMFTTDPDVRYTQTNNNEYMYTNNWLNNVASTGTFVKNVNATWTLTGASGIPSGWTVQTASY